MDRTVGGPLIPTTPLNNVLNQATVVQLHTHMPALCIPSHTLLNYHVCMCLWAPVDCLYVYINVLICP